MAGGGFEEDLGGDAVVGLDEVGEAGLQDGADGVVLDGAVVFAAFLGPVLVLKEPGRGRSLGLDHARDAHLADLPSQYGIGGGHRLVTGV